MTTRLAYSYPAAARILSASGYTDEEIAAFLTKHQNESGYIPASLLPPVRKQQ